MRTTVTLDDDIAIRLEQLRAERGRSFKAVINDVLRAGLEAVQQIPAQRAREEISYTVPLPGRLLLSVEQAIEAADDEYFQQKLR